MSSAGENWQRRWEEAMRRRAAVNPLAGRTAQTIEEPAR